MRGVGPERQRRSGAFCSVRAPGHRDSLAGFQGPLAGVLAGLDWVAANRPDLAFAVSAPTDTPFLPSDLVARLQAARFEKGADLACARSASGAHPVIALWPVAIRAELRHALVEEDLHKVGLFTQRFRLACADWTASRSIRFSTPMTRRTSPRPRRSPRREKNILLFSINKVEILATLGAL